MLRVEAVDVRAPERGQVGGARPAPPQPEPLSKARLARQVVDLDQDQRPPPRRPRAAAAPVGGGLGFGMHAGPGADADLAVLSVGRPGLRGPGPPGPLVGAGGLRPIAARAPALPAA